MRRQKQNGSNAPIEDIEYLIVDEVLRMTRLGRSTLYEKMARNEFPRNRRTGGRWRVWVKSEIQAWMNEQPTYEPRVNVVRLSREEAAKRGGRVRRAAA